MGGFVPMMDLAWASLLPLAGAGFAVGLLVGLTGVGGGALMTPLLISTFGVTPQVAVGTDLLYASITKTAGSWRHHLSDHVEWRIVALLCAGSIPAALILLAAMAWLPLNTVALAHWIRLGLVVALPLSGIAIVLYPLLRRTAMREVDLQTEPRALATVLFGAALGLLVTLTSVGAGAIGVSVLAADLGGRPRPSRAWARRCRALARAARGFDPRHPDRFAPCRHGAGVGPAAAARGHAVLRGLGALP
jgi:uncharacterized membrane protein YfcA